MPKKHYNHPVVLEHRPQSTTTTSVTLSALKIIIFQSILGKDSTATGTETSVRFSAWWSGKTIRGWGTESKGCDKVLKD